MATNNSCDYAPTQYNVQVGGASGTLANVSPSSTSGVPIISQGASSNPSFGTAVVAGGGSGLTSTTAYAVMCGGTTSTAALQQVSGLGTSTYVLTSNGAGALPTWQAAAGGSAGTITGNSGGAISQSAGNWNILTAHTNLGFTGSGSTLTLDFYDSKFNTFLGGKPSAATGQYNVGVGESTLGAITSGTENCALGAESLYYLTTGSYNMGFGENTLQVTSGSYNIGIGQSAGQSYTSSESNNIAIQNYGTISESNVCRIGSGTGTGTRQLNATYIAGIQGITVTGTAVLISSSDQLGVAVSSKRYKENIKDMPNSFSQGIMDLRPTIFNYTVGEDKSLQGGLIAEEVYETMPQLVVLDKEGLPQTVKYHDLPALLLNELQKLSRRVAELESKLSS